MRTTSMGFCLLCLMSMALPGGAAETQAASLTIQTDQPGAKVSPWLYGIFFEEINCSGDGGLYAERVRNRSFEDSEKPEHWALVNEGGEATMALDTAKPLSTLNAHSLKLTITKPGVRVGVANEGWWGMALKQGAVYDLSFWARAEGITGPLAVELKSADGAVVAQGVVTGLGADWKRFSLELSANATVSDAKLFLTTTQQGTLWLDMVSLFPRDTFKNRPNGLRPDLAQMLAGLKPSFMRFPGGCWVEGDKMDLAMRWKRTIGDVADRRTQYNIWQYMSTNGLGYHEYLQLCEDLGAEPLFVINCGMSHKENVPMDKMQEFVQDALDAIEYANGPADSTWGAARAKNGHPAPFGLKLMEIGNENGGPAYQERYALFYDAIKAKHPDMKLIGNVPTEQRPSDIVDEHYYASPEFFIANANKYDGYDRKGPKIYVGEYAVTQKCGQGNLIAALGEAAFMTGMERNSDQVIMASYAPLFANTNYKKWNPDLIDFDNSRVFGIPSYYVQKLFSEHRGNAVLPAKIEAPETSADVVLGGAVGVGTWDTQAEFKDLRVSNGDKTVYESDFTKGMGSVLQSEGDWSVKDGALRQTGNGMPAYAVVGDTGWTDYTYSLKARKLGGKEGFLILVRARDTKTFLWWNIGGWGNRMHGLEKSDESGKGPWGASIPGSVETGRWYDIRIEAQGRNVRCYLDNKLIQDVSYPTMRAMYVSATRHYESGDVIAKVVNVSGVDLDTNVHIEGASIIRQRATVITLTGPNPDAENTLEAPTTVAPVEASISDASPEFRHTFPAYSLTVLRVNIKN